MRKIHLLGTHGELAGVFDDNRFTIRHSDLRPGCEYRENVIDLNNLGDTTGAFGGHGGGDERLAADFVKFIRGEKPSLACTSIFDSVAGHLCVYLADNSRENGGIPQEVKL